MKYFQVCLTQIASIMTEEEKNNIKKLTLQFLLRHDYFGLNWKNLSEQKRNKVIEVIADAKGLNAYEKVVTTNSLDFKPEIGSFFENCKFYSYLKQKFVMDEDDENSRFLYTTLQMKNLSNMNDLYDAQDVLFLLEIIENRFDVMYQKYFYNQRKCNSASSLSGCIQRDL